MFLKLFAAAVLLATQLCATSAIISGPIYITDTSYEGKRITVSFAWTKAKVDLTGNVVRQLVINRAFDEARDICRRNRVKPRFESMQVLPATEGRFPGVIFQLK